MTTGNALDFGDLTTARMGTVTAMSPTRGLIFGGYTTAHTKEIDMITIASKGNGLDFGDNTFTGGYGAGCSNQTRGLFVLLLWGDWPGSLRPQYQPSPVRSLLASHRNTEDLRIEGA